MLRVQGLEPARTRPDMTSSRRFREDPLPMPDAELNYEVERHLMELMQRHSSSTPPTPAERVSAEIASGLAYHRSGFRLPDRVEWLPSPSAIPASAPRRMILMRSFDNNLSQRFWHRVWTHVSSVISPIRTRISPRERPEGSVSAETPRFRASLRAGLGGMERRSSILPMSSSSGTFVASNPRTFLGSAVYAENFVAGLAFYAAVGILRGTGQLITDSEYVEHELMRNVYAGFPTTDVLYLIERPTLVKFDRDGLLHREDGPAVEYADGTGAGYWRGNEIPVDWVTGKPPSPAVALTWPNMDQRAAACELVGWINILRSLRARILDRDPDPMIGELVQVYLPDQFEPQKFLVVKCGTGRDFALPVPPQTRTAIHGQSLLHDLPEDVIRSIERRT